MKNTSPITRSENMIICRKRIIKVEVAIVKAQFGLAKSHFVVE